MSTDSSPGSSTTVSVICRTVGRPELEQALASVAAQQHQAIELILVDAANQGLEAPDLPSGLSPKIVNQGKALPRASAANAGLEAATGDYLIFLDEDDWIAADHISTLLACLQANPDVQAAYSSTRKTDREGNELDLAFREDYQPLLLMRDNFIPIHAMLFDASLLEKGCRFDEQFDVFEDWDFWLQLAQFTRFIHVDQITAFYREGGESDTGISEIEKRFDAKHPSGIARAKVFNKWLKQWDGEKLNALLGDLERIQKSVSKSLDEEHDANLAQQEQIRELLAAREKLDHELNISEQKLAELEAHSAKQETENQEIRAAIADLRNHIALIHSSLSWKITKPLRGLRRLISGSSKKQQNTPEDQQ